MLVSPMPTLTPLALSDLLSRTDDVKFPVDVGTNAAIKSFLDYVKDSSPQTASKILTEFCRDCVSKLRTQADSKSGLCMAQAEALASKLNKYEFPGWKKSISVILAKFQELAGCRDPNKYQRLVADISKELSILQYSASFFTSLVNTPKTLGTLHCEISLATFFILSPGEFEGKYDAIVKELKVRA